MARKIAIRKAIRNDASFMHDLHTRSVWGLCNKNYTGDQIHGWIDHRTPEGYYSAIDAGKAFVVLEDSVIVGFGEAISGEILAIYVSPDHTGKGIGSLLLCHAIEIGQSDSHRVVLDATLNAVDFYRKRGFVEVERKIVRRGNTELPCVLMEYGK